MIDALILSNQIFNIKLNGLQDSIRESNQVAEIIDRNLSQRPFHLNVIQAACRGNFKETGHSLVLADMLRHPQIQSSFMKTFLGFDHDYMNVTAEKDRVDVALKGDDIFVIVENKVNAAGEQSNQVYRYVHDIGIKKYGYEMSQIYVVYLNPSNHSMPSDYSLCDENNENNVFEELGVDHYSVKSYKYDITDWLRKITIEKEPHISSALDQYIDFLEQKFHTSPLDKKMNKEIKDLLLKELQIEGKSNQEQINALDTQYDKVNELLNAIDSLRHELKKKHSHELMREWQRQVESQLGIKVAEDDHSFGVQLNNKVWLGVWDGYDNDTDLPYWGFQMDPEKRKGIPELDAKIKEILKESQIEIWRPDKYFIAWNSTKKGADRFMSLYHSAKKLGLL